MNCDICDINFLILFMKLIPNLIPKSIIDYLMNFSDSASVNKVFIQMYIYPVNRYDVRTVEILIFHNETNKVFGEANFITRS